MLKSDNLSGFVVKLRRTSGGRSASNDINRNNAESSSSCMNTCTNGLTDAQQSAVIYNGKPPLVILASAGSGKTLTITRRIAWMLSQGVSGSNILALTFTRKAAEEMKSRVMSSIDWKKATLITVCNFHQLALRILRDHYKEVGFTQQFTVLGVQQQRQIVEECIAEYKKRNSGQSTPLSIPQNYSNDKSDRADDDLIESSIAREEGGLNTQSSSSFCKSAVSAREIDYFTAFIRKAKSKHQKPSSFVSDHRFMLSSYLEALTRQSAIDFSDMIPLSLCLLRKRPFLLQKYRQQYSHVLVDEYQDVSADQFELLKLLASEASLTVCGDDDQSIYGWRGGSVRSFELLSGAFGEHSIVTLCQNFRSTANILKVSQSLIDQNKTRTKKALMTKNAAGEPVRLLVSGGPREEAKSIAAEIRRRRTAFGDRWSSFAILSRTRYVLHVVWAVLKRENIPVRIIAGRGRSPESSREVQDLIAYCSLINGSKDSDKAFIRVCNVPKRNFGKTTLAALQDFAKLRNISLIEAASSRVNLSGRLSPRQIQAVHSFSSLIKSCKQKIQTLKPDQCIAEIVKAIGYQEFIDESSSGDSVAGDRKANLSSLVDFISSDPSPTLQEAIDHYLDPKLRERALLCPDVVSVSTVHQAKGREWDTVFIARFNDSQFPLSKREEDDSFLVNKSTSAESHKKSSLDDHLEEERRLAFVALTRAKLCLWLSFTLMDANGNPEIPSRFLEELPHHLIKSAKDASKETDEAAEVPAKENHQTSNLPASARVFDKPEQERTVPKLGPTTIRPATSHRKRQRSSLGFNTRPRMSSLSKRS